MKVLLAVDGSPCSEAAVEEVCRRPWPKSTEVRVLMVDSPMNADFWPGQPGTAFDQINEQIRSEAVRRLNHTVGVIKREAPELLVVPILLEGRPKDIILREAGEWGADLVMVGSNGWGPVGRFFLGSVSLAVATNALCSVEIVRARPAR